MEWIKIKITTSHEGVEIISGLLINNGISGMEIEDDKEMHKFFKSQKGTWDYIDEDLINRNRDDVFIGFYVSNDPKGKEILLIIKNNIEDLKNENKDLNLGTLELEIENVNDEDWLNNWKQYYKTFELGDKIVIKPAWEKYENNDNKIVFEIEPGYAFGTGLHETTQLSLLSLEKYVTKTSTILDLGTGTGILSIIGMLLGAKEAHVIDIDHCAIKTALENAKINKIDMNKYHGYSGDISKDIKLINTLKKRKYEIITANIVADVIISIKDFVKEVLHDDGIFISSGIIDDRKEDVKNHLIESGYEIVDVLDKKGWVSIIAKKKR